MFKINDQVTVINTDTELAVYGVGTGKRKVGLKGYIGQICTKKWKDWYIVQYSDNIHDYGAYHYSELAITTFPLYDWLSVVKE